MRNDGELVNQRTQFINETENRIVHVRKLTLDIENTLLEEIRNLNETISKKDAEIAYLLKCDKEEIQNN